MLVPFSLAIVAIQTKPSPLPSSPSRLQHAHLRHLHPPGESTVRSQRVVLHQHHTSISPLTHLRRVLRHQHDRNQQPDPKQHLRQQRGTHTAQLGLPRVESRRRDVQHTHAHRARTVPHPRRRPQDRLRALALPRKPPGRDCELARRCHS